MLFGEKKAEEAFEPFRGIVNTRQSNLFIRAGSSRVLVNIASVPKGTRLTVTGREGEWYRVSYRGAKGFAHSKYILPLDRTLFAEDENE